MNNNNLGQQLSVIDILTLISFGIQLQNQGNIIYIKDVQNEVDRAVEDIHKHLQQQDDKIDKIMEVLGIENYKMSE